MAPSSTSLHLISCQEWPHWARSGWASSSPCSSSSTRTSSSRSHTYQNTSKGFNYWIMWHIPFTSCSYLLYKSGGCYCYCLRLYCTAAVFHWQTTWHLCVCVNQVAKRHSVPLGLNADWLHQHPHVLSGVAMDARRLPTFLPARPSAGQGGTARRERTRLHDVSEVKTRTKSRRCFERRADWKQKLVLFWRCRTLMSVQILSKK